MVIADSRTAVAGRPPAPPPAAEERGASLGVILAVLALLAGGYALTILVFHPGYITIDASYVYATSQGLALRRLAVAGDEPRLVADRPDRARRAEHVPADRHVVLGGLRPGRAHGGAPQRVARPGDAVRRARAAGILFRRDDLARRAVRRRLAGRRGARSRGCGSLPAGTASRCRRWRCCWSRSASFCGPTPSSRRR